MEEFSSGLWIPPQDSITVVLLFDLWIEMA